MFNRVYINASEAFADIYGALDSMGVANNGTKKIHNVGIKILNPGDNHIKVEGRKWNPRYAEREWDWYMSENRSVEDLKKYAPIWDKMHSGDNIVNSNYGFIWNQNGQLDNVVNILKEDPQSRQAWITIYDGKDHAYFDYDTPCTLAIGFAVERGALCMTVIMRSNDLWFGFCNDQYCFSRLQALVSKRTGIKVGWYYHYASDMHLYKQQFNRKLG